MKKILGKILSAVIVSSIFMGTFVGVNAEEVISTDGELGIEENVESPGEDIGQDENINDEEDIDVPDNEHTVDENQDPRESIEEPIDNSNLEISQLEDDRAMPSGGPYVGQLTKVPRSIATTVNIYSDAAMTNRITYLENGTNSGVFAMIDQSRISYKISLSGIVGWVEKKYVDYYAYANVRNGYDAFQVENGRLYHYIGRGVNTNSWSIALDQGPAPSYLGGGEYISYDSHYFYPATVVGLNNYIADVNEGSHRRSVNPKDPFYNYFMWLPARTQSNLSATDYRNFLESKGYRNNNQSRLYFTEQSFINNGHRYAGNSTLAFATAIHESGYGTSNFARQRNNYFGHAAYDSAPGMATAYLDPDEGIAYHMGTYWSWRYLYPLKGGRNNGGSVGNKAVGMNVDYASDPYWGEKIANYYFQLDRFVGNKDYGKYTLGVFNTAEVNVRKQPTTSSQSVYKSTVVGMPVAVIESSNGWYGFTSDLIMDANKNEPPAVPWTAMRFDTSTVYSSGSYIDIVHNGWGSKLGRQVDIPYPKKPKVNSTKETFKTRVSTPLRPDASKYYPGILTVPAGTTVTGHKTNNGFVQIIYGSNIGFISIESITGFTELPKPGNTSVRSRGIVYLRTGPHASYEQIADIPKGEIVQVGSAVNGWVHVKYKDMVGYANAGSFEEVLIYPEPGESEVQTRGNVILRTGPSSSFSQIMVMPKGTVVKIGKAINGWVHVQVGDIKGYSSATVYEKIPKLPQPGTKEMQTRGNVIMRSGPDTSYGQIMVIPVGTVVVIGTEENGWVHVQVGNINGYSSSSVYIDTPKRGNTEVLTRGNVIIRKGPNSNQEQITVVPKGTSAKIGLAVNGWVYVETENYSGYSSAAVYDTIPLPGKDIVQTRGNVILREGPGTNYSQITVIPRGMKVVIGNESNGWVHVQFGDLEGFTSSSVYEPLTWPQPGSLIATTRGNVILRRGPSTDFNQIIVIPKGTQVQIGEDLNGWVYVKYGELSGYSSSSVYE